MWKNGSLVTSKGEALMGMVYQYGDAGIILKIYPSPFTGVHLRPFQSKASIQYILINHKIKGGFVQNGDLDSARILFDKMPERNLATWIAMVGGLIQFEFNEEGMCLFGKMHGMGLFPDKFTLGSVLRGCVGSKEVKLGQQIHGYVMKSGIDFDLVVGSSLAHMYMKCGNMSDGEKVFEGMPVHNVIGASNTIIAVGLKTDALRELWIDLI
ncbi:hypothetical protein IFM89_023168 [Coptis chinensis]|uniref:Pentatricopeptide repeat-containing protein n=1 Tax=Coptis chinensis TaxID=261450 RepID=A0A835MC40_9MAGN|nr:hypothetical protein IFM89_023168 [Coptis chinensis]